MPKKRKSKKEKGAPDISMDLFHQMGLDEDEIKSVLDLAEKIEKKVASQKEFGVVPTYAPINIVSNVPTAPESDQKSNQDFHNIIEIQKTALNYFHNVIAIQFGLLIKKCKDKLISLEEKLLKQNVEITSLEKKVLEQKAEVENLTHKLEFLLK